MKKIIWQLVIPITVIIFASIDRWTYALVIDAPSTVLNGFPFISSAEAWHTSMATQIFIFEFLSNLFIFFTVIFLIIYSAYRVFKMTQVNKWIYIPLWVFTIPLIILAPVGVLMFDDIIFTHRDFKIEILDQKYYLSWTGYKRPKLEDYIKTQKHYKKSKNEINWSTIWNFKINHKIIKRSPNPFLQSGYTTKKIERIVFIDSIKKLKHHKLIELQKIILDTNNLYKNDNKDYRFVVNNGIVFFNKDNEMSGSMSFNYDFEDIYFNPKFRNKNSWGISESAREKIKRILNEK